MNTTFKTIEKNINKLRMDYGEITFRMAISHLMDVGMRNLTPELVNEATGRKMYDIAFQYIPSLDKKEVN